MKELDDEELVNVEGGQLASVKFDLAKLTSDSHYWYPKKSLKKGTDGNYTYDKTSAEQRKPLSKSMKVVDAVLGKNEIPYKTATGVVTLIHVKKIGTYGDGYINKKVLHTQVKLRKLD